MNSCIKSILSLFLLTVFLLQISSRVLIYADYYINRDYVAKVLCINKDKPKMQCNGKCHLKKELDKEESKEQSPVNPVKEKNEIQLFSDSKTDINFPNNTIEKNRMISLYSFVLSDKHTLAIFHPPSA